MSDWKVIEEKVAFTSIHFILLFSERSHQLHNSVNISAMKLSQGGTEIRRILLLPVQLNTNYEYIEPKAEKQKIQCLVTKTGKNSIQQDFLRRDPYILGGFICYFLVMTILSSQKLKNAKYRFGLQKGVKNSLR